MDAALFPTFVPAAGQPAGDGGAANGQPGPAGALFGSALESALERPGAAAPASSAGSVRGGGAAQPSAPAAKAQDDPAAVAVPWFNLLAFVQDWQPDAAMPAVRFDIQGSGDQSPHEGADTPLEAVMQLPAGLPAGTGPTEASPTGPADREPDRRMPSGLPEPPDGADAVAHPVPVAAAPALPVPLDVASPPASMAPDEQAAAEGTASPAARSGESGVHDPGDLRRVRSARPVEIRPAVKPAVQPGPAADPAPTAAAQPPSADGFAPAPAQDGAGHGWTPQGIEAEPPLRALSSPPAGQAAQRLGPDSEPQPVPQARPAGQAQPLETPPAPQSPSFRRPVTVEELVRLALRGAMVEGTPSERIPLGSPVPANLEARLQTAAARVLMESSAGLRESWLRQAADRPVPPPTPGFESGVNPEPEPTPDPSTDAPAADPLPLRSVGEARWTAEPDSAAVLPAGAAPVTSSRDGGQHPGSGDAQGRPRPRAAAPIAVDAALHAASARLSAADLASRVSELAQRPPVETPEPPAPEPTVDGEPLNHAVVRSLKFQWTQGGGEARLQLRPEYLGDLTVSLRVSGASVTAILSADSASVRSWIDAHQSDLRRALEAQGLSLDSLIIDPDGHGQERQESSGQQEHRAPYRRRHEAGRFEALL